MKRKKLHPQGIGGGIVHGKGTRTSDSIPVNLSRDEAVLPGETVDKLGGPKAVERLIHKTTGKPPVKGGIRAGGSYFRGAVDAVGAVYPTGMKPEDRDPEAPLSWMSEPMDPNAPTTSQIAASGKALSAMRTMTGAEAEGVNAAYAAPTAPTADNPAGAKPTAPAPVTAAPAAAAAATTAPATNIAESIRYGRMVDAETGTGPGAYGTQLPQLAMQKRFDAYNDPNSKALENRNKELQLRGDDIKVSRGIGGGINISNSGVAPALTPEQQESEKQRIANIIPNLKKQLLSERLERATYDATNSEIRDPRVKAEGEKNMKALSALQSGQAAQELAQQKEAGIGGMNAAHIRKTDADIEAGKTQIGYDETIDEFGKKTRTAVPFRNGNRVEQKAAAPTNGIPAPKSKAEMDALPKGATFIDPNGIKRIKP